jgi:hypothetical protein
MSQETMREGAPRMPPVELEAARMKRQRRPQREILLEVLRIAAQYETWVTLEELAGKTKFPPASISAQLRHLRKARFGGWTVERRRRTWVGEELVWEYRLGG